MSVFLCSAGQQDGQALNGGAVSVGDIPGVYFVADYNVVLYRRESQGSLQYLQLAEGGEFVGIWSDYGTYLETGDTGFTFRWKFWARGEGTVALTQDMDPTWSVGALPATGIGDLVVSASDWTVYHVAAGAIDLDDLLGGDAVRLGLSMTTGAVDITTLQLECVPDSGAYGWWVNQPSYDQGPFTAIAHGAGGISIPSEYSSSRVHAWDLAYDELLATNPANETDPTSLGIDNLFHYVSAEAPAWGRSNPNVGDPGEEYMGQMNMGVYKTWVNASTGFAVASGEEGVDFIRIPGFTPDDGDIAYTRSAGNRNNKPTGHVDWNTPKVIFHRENSTVDGAYASLDLRVWLSVVEEEGHADTAPIDWTARGAPLRTLTPTSDEYESADISLPSSGIFALYAYAAALTGDEDDKPLLPGMADNEVVIAYWDAEIWVQSEYDSDTPEHADLTYMQHLDAFSVWDPNGVPPGGQLKLRMLDDTWRILGNPEDTGGRLKIQTPDLTWWKEYRTSDGAVPVHPLKLYTTDGWVVVDYLTPD